MMNNPTYGAHAIAEDLENLGEEILNDTARTLDETKPQHFDFGEWKRLREAVEAMREKLDEIEELIGNAEDDALDFDEDAAEDRYESWWE